MPTIRPFTEQLRKANLYRGLSFQHIQILQLIESEPLPAPSREKVRGANLPSPSPVKGSSLGPVVAQKMCKLEERWNGKFYVITNDGAVYLAALRAAGLIEKRQHQKETAQ